MLRYIKVILFILVVSFLLAFITTLTGAQKELLSWNTIYFAIGGFLVYLASIFFWLLSWAYMLRAYSSFKALLRIGFASVCGAVSPMQVGADALRVYLGKQLLGVDTKKNLAACLFSKGIKFATLGLFSGFVLFWLYLNVSLSFISVLSFIFALIAIVLAVFFFLGPGIPALGLRISKFFHYLAHHFHRLSWMGDFFEVYSTTFYSLGWKGLSVVVAFALLSFALEAFAVAISFMAAGIFLGIVPFIIIAIVLLILEKSPFLPRGVGLVELAGYILLKTPFVVQSSFTLAQIGAAIVVFDIVRLLGPVILSFTYLSLGLHTPNK